MKLATKTLFAALATTGLIAGSASAVPVLLGGFDGTNAADAPKQDASVVGLVTVTAASANDDGFGGNFNNNGGAGGDDALLWGLTSFTPAADNLDSKSTKVGESFTLDLTITNNATVDLDLDAIHFLARRDNAAASPTSLLLEYLSGDLADADGTDIVTQGLANSFTGYDQSLSGLSDTTLAAGESATFRVLVAGNIADGNGQWVRIDNFAISGELVPEPGSLALLGLGGLLIGARRRRG